ncbi:Uncharacterized protein QTN25_009608 [Entamoeba marina]
MSDFNRKRSKTVSNGQRISPFRGNKLTIKHDYVQHLVDIPLQIHHDENDFQQNTPSNLDLSQLLRVEYENNANTQPIGMKVLPPPTTPHSAQLSPSNINIDVTKSIICDYETQDLSILQYLNKLLSTTQKFQGQQLSELKAWKKRQEKT